MVQLLDKLVSNEDMGMMVKELQEHSGQVVKLHDDLSSIESEIDMMRLAYVVLVNHHGEHILKMDGHLGVFNLTKQLIGMQQFNEKTALQ